MSELMNEFINGGGYYYFYSAILQSFAALIGLLIVGAVFKFREYEKSTDEDASDLVVFFQKLGDSLEDSSRLSVISNSIEKLKEFRKILDSAFKFIFLLREFS